MWTRLILPQKVQCQQQKQISKTIQQHQRLLQHRPMILWLNLKLIRLVCVLIHYTCSWTSTMIASFVLYPFMKSITISICFLQESKEKQIIKPLKTLVKRLNLKILLAPPTLGSVGQLFSYFLSCSFSQKSVSNCTQQTWKTSSIRKHVRHVNGIT